MENPTNEQEWNPGKGDRVIIKLPLGGSQTDWAGEITWHGMLDSEWGGFTVTLDQKHPAFTQTIGPFRADVFKTMARPEQPELTPEQMHGYAILNDLHDFIEEYGHDAAFNLFSKLALPWREESSGFGEGWYRRFLNGNTCIGRTQTHNQAKYDRGIIEQGYTILEEVPRVREKKEKKDTSVKFATSGTVYTMETFIEMVHDGCFCDDDGWGYYATVEEESSVPVYPSKYYAPDRNYTHVVWYNK